MTSHGKDLQLQLLIIFAFEIQLIIAAQAKGSGHDKLTFRNALSA